MPRGQFIKDMYGFFKTQNGQRSFQWKITVGMVDFQAARNNTLNIFVLDAGSDLLNLLWMKLWIS